MVLFLNRQPPWFYTTNSQGDIYDVYNMIKIPRKTCSVNLPFDPLWSLLDPFGEYWLILRTYSQNISKWFYYLGQISDSPQLSLSPSQRDSKTLTDGQGGGEAASGGCHHQQLGDVRWFKVLPTIGWSKYSPQIIPNHWKSSTFCETSSYILRTLVANRSFSTWFSRIQPPSPSRSSPHPPSTAPFWAPDIASDPLAPRTWRPAARRAALRSARSCWGQVSLCPGNRPWI